MATPNFDRGLKQKLFCYSRDAVSAVRMDLKLSHTQCHTLLAPNLKIE